MTISNTLKTALIGLKTNRSRSLLTILGIVIGITAIIMVMSLGQGAQGLILGQVEGLGSNTIAVIPGREPTGPSDSAQIFSDSLKQGDLVSLQRKENVPTLKDIMPVVFGGESVAYEGETYRATIFGASAIFPDFFDAEPVSGSFFSEEDVKAYSDSIIIGSKVKDELFAGNDPLGNKVKIKNKNYKIAGVLPKKGQSSFVNFDEMVIMPYTTAGQYAFGIKYYHRFMIKADSDENIDQTVKDIKATLRANHNIIDPSKDDFFVQTQADLMKTLGVITNVLTLFLTSIAAISLVVGGIGIMNIMLVSVTERTREIGLRKAVGATNKNILSQFLIEAIVLTGIGGVVGILLGTLLSFLVAVVLSQVVGLDWNFVFPVGAAIIGILVSTAIGLVFGLYPARKASLKSPIEALRYE